MKHHPILSVKARTINFAVRHFKLTPHYRYMKKIHNSHLGKSCFVIGNGPSLTVEDLDKLAENHIDCFAMNRIYKIFPQTKWRPTYYVNTDWTLARDVLDSVDRVPAKQKFFPIQHMYEESFRKSIRKRALFCLKPPDAVGFKIDCTESLRGVGTVTIASIQLAAHMGYRNIYLLGVDHNFDNIIDENGNTVVNEGVKNYFVDDYDTDILSEVTHDIGNTTRRYYEVQAYYPKNGVNIYNATRTTKLDVFPKVSFEEAVKSIVIDTNS